MVNTNLSNRPFLNLRVTKISQLQNADAMLSKVLLNIAPHNSNYFRASYNYLPMRNAKVTSSGTPRLERT